MILISAGSEIELVVSAAKALRKKGVKFAWFPCRVPSVSITGCGVQRVGIAKSCTQTSGGEASIAGFWERYVGLDGKVIG